ncbi:MAG: hypothetical protein ACHQFX_01815 [Chitinophagales bacterium]
MNKLTLTLLFILTCFCLQAQDTLPKFSVRNVGNKRIIIEWVNNFQNANQISIQRSFDSLKGYKTILTVPDPSNPQNGYADTKADNDHMFYRLYILLERGVYLFSNIKRPVMDTMSAGKRINGMPGKPSVVIPVIGGDSVTNIRSNNKPKIEAWIPSKYVYTNNDGYVRISLPDDPDKKYGIRFFTSDDKPIFELKDIKERTFKLDKTSFYRSGWFKFELYRDGELIEKNKFFLPKEF